jgi:2-dehydropantoate 2-reductase
MKTLVVGVGALGGLIAARLLAAGVPVSLATRDARTAALLKASGLRVSGVGGALAVPVTEAAPVEDFLGGFDLIVLATKAGDAMEVAPRLPGLLGPGGTLLPIQNGSVALALADLLGADRVLGGLSNLGAAMTAPGAFEQRNAGHLLIGEVAGGESERAERVGRWLGQGVEARVTANFRGAVWSKLLINCAGTTIGAVAGGTLRQFTAAADGREMFGRVYDEALAVALASGARPERMVVDPVPPGWNGRSVPSDAQDAWLAQVLQGYGDAKPSMLQDFERGRATEIDYLNGHVVALGRQLGIPTPVNAALVETVHAITRGRLAPGMGLLGTILTASRAEDPGKGAPPTSRPGPAPGSR